MNELERQELIPQDIIRSETVLSRFPIHRLSKKGSVSIEIKVRRPDGELKTRWQIKNPPAPLAYRIDTLIINRRIEEAGKPVPKLLRIGSLREISEELGVKKSGNTERVKNAIIQNVGAVIKAKFTYKTTDGTERTIEIADTRYAAIFTGEKLPNGNKADATYILLHDIYREILNSAPTRPLDYDYMRELSPAAQRFYELLSYQMYAALKNKITAKMLYSHFCLYAPLTRHFDWENMRSQMLKLHRPHLQSGYIERVKFEQQRNDDGTLDWLMIYVPGQKAKGEHALAMRKPLPRARRIEKNEYQLPLIPELPTPKLLPEPELVFSPDEESLVSKLKKFGVAEPRARELVKSHRQAVETQITAFPYREAKPPKNAAGWLIAAIEGNYTLPVTYLEEQEKKQKAVATDEKAATIAACKLCDERGFRFIKSERFPNGAVKPCTHDPKIESKFQPAF